jgi:O-succinylbenzoate synthase
MRADSIDLYHIAMPLLAPWRTSFGEDDKVESVLVRLGCGESFGWGEATPWTLPSYSPEYAAAVFLTVKDILAPRIGGREIGSGEELQRELVGIRGNHFAKAALDLAWWDMEARRSATPLWKLIGGKRRDIVVGEAFGIQDSLEQLLRSIETAVARGYRRIKLKYGHGWEIDVIEVVRRQFPQTTIHIDCNSAYTLADVEMFLELDRFDLAMIEQPLGYDDLVDHADLQSKIKTPICLDESITSIDRARKAIRLKSCRWINIKHGRVGGITNALAIHRLCHEAGIPCWVGGMLESGIGTAHSAALASLANIRYPSDILPAGRFYREDLAQPEMTISAPSEMTLSDRPGTGVEPHPGRLQAQTLQKTTLRF